MRKHHSCDHLLDILTEVNRLVVERGQKADAYGKPQPIQVPAPVHTLRAKVYLWISDEVIIKEDHVEVSTGRIDIYFYNISV